MTPEIVTQLWERRPSFDAIVGVEWRRRVKASIGGVDWRRRVETSVGVVIEWSVGGRRQSPAQYNEASRMASGV